MKGNREKENIAWAKSQLAFLGGDVLTPGEKAKRLVLNMRHVNFGGLELRNVKASVVKSQKAPLLLGQSVLERLGRIEIDNEGRVVKVTHVKR